jgi:hypothetical protein
MVYSIWERLDRIGWIKGLWPVDRRLVLAHGLKLVARGAAAYIGRNEIVSRLRNYDLYHPPSKASCRDFLLKVRYRLIADIQQQRKANNIILPVTVVHDWGDWG